MSHACRFLLPLLVWLLACAFYPAQGQNAKDRGAEPGAARADAKARPIEGSAACANRGCHGQPAQQDTKDKNPSSFWLWHQYDPHHQATFVLDKLSSPLAKRMGELLGMKDVAQEPRCLACHTTPQANGSEGWARDEQRFGVGCESCHGSAKGWLTKHVSKEWKSLTPAQKLAEGMIPLESLHARAEACAGCHVGAKPDLQKRLPLRLVDHDFIAAGHPRLAFEMSAFLSNLPRHWTERPKNSTPDFPARTWKAGQVAIAKAALELIIDNATSPDPGRWPEFTDYSCYACHHNLTAAGRPSKGTLKLATWPFALLPVAGGKADGKLLELMNRRNPSRGESPAEARRLWQSLDSLASKVEEPLDAAALASMREDLVKRGLAAQDWDELEQVALGLVAVLGAERAVTGKADEGREKAVRELLEALQLQPGQGGPVSGWTPQAAIEKLKAVANRGS